LIELIRVSGGLWRLKKSRNVSFDFPKIGPRSSGGSRESCAKTVWLAERTGFETPRPLIALSYCDATPTLIRRAHQVTDEICFFGGQCRQGQRPTLEQPSVGRRCQGSASLRGLGVSNTVRCGCQRLCIVFFGAACFSCKSKAGRFNCTYGWKWILPSRPAPKPRPSTVPAIVVGWPIAKPSARFRTNNL
jgi:hypothetical protein